ncbi:MAG: hypothetical protein K0R73_1046 [Candidatus Midichloriaceae bacterium]|jgi:DUF1009 family protein|nr:hypothetical protein [Candidatus Midichloriaceae bacterium]
MSHNKISKLGILAGAGNLPKHVADACKAKSIEYCIIGLDDEMDSHLFEGEKDLHKFKIHSVSKILAKLKEENVTHVTLTGRVKRADLARLLLDIKGAKLLALILKNGIADNAILTTIMHFIESEGFKIVAPESVASDIIVQKGCLTKVKPDESATKDIHQGLKVLKGIASFDVGQSLIIQGGLTLGVEAAEGTDELIKRCGEVKQVVDVAPILIKVAKPNQDRRVDLPCIGPRTIELAFKYGIRGIAIDSGSTLLLEPEETIKLANKYKIFIIGI